VALFTATSAACVTGLIVETTGTYWSRMGQTVILCLFQLGGLGIMTWGAFFALAGGGQMQVKESATLRGLLESDTLGDVRRMLRAIVAFTFTSELAGALLLLGLWPELPFAERLYFGVFHSVSAFCNAGFALTPDSFVGMGMRWQVWGVVPALIIVGGLGFAVLYNLSVLVRSNYRELQQPPLFHLPRRRVRLTLTSTLVLVTTGGLLLAGAAAYDLLESTNPRRDASWSERLAEAWFQSVTFRTAGFNSVDHGRLQPATKLLAVLLMFIGASPGSTGGGVKTVCFALAVMAVVSILRGREQVEIRHRTISTLQTNRALVVIALGAFLVMLCTLLLAVFENQPGRFLDHLYEATSALGTVGVSTGITAGLSGPSQVVLIVGMFLGRVGPLTLLMALAGRGDSARYHYPAEPVTLG
jgi:trk system potassium uptake protein TrkH